MTTAVPKTSRERVRSYRARRRAQGLRSVTFWLPDTSSPEFIEQARRDSLAVAGSPEEEEVMQFISEAMDWPPDEEPFWHEPDETKPAG